ncbi:hypothetical protein HDU67_006149 [Dinochytrium kinnereticum]|nr:hypothetical protein HDU67_006149 [Dinochytrium kinnereticum]
MYSIVRIGERIESLVDIIPLSSIKKRDELSNVRALNVHDNKIRSIDHDVILLLPMLTRIDLSCNEIISMEGIHGAYNLVELNLSNNQHLKDLILHGEQSSENNPICELENYGVTVKRMLPQLRSLDSADAILEVDNIVDVSGYLSAIESRPNQAHSPRSFPDHPNDRHRTKDFAPDDVDHFPRSSHRLKATTLDRLEKRLENLMSDLEQEKAVPLNAAQETTRLSALESQMAVLVDLISRKAARNNETVREAFSDGSSDKENSSPGRRRQKSKSQKTGLHRKSPSMIPVGVRSKQPQSHWSDHEDDSSESQSTSDSHSIQRRKDSSRKQQKRKEDKKEAEQSQPTPSIDTQKIISDLEKEEARLKENEMRYAAKIKELSESLTDNEKNKKVNEVTAMKNDADAKSAEAFRVRDKHHEELVELLKVKDKELATLASTIDNLQNEREQFLEDFNHAKHLIRETEDGKSKVTIRLLKEREAYKVTIAEIKKENEIYRDTIFKLERDVNYLQEMLQNRDSEFNSKLEYSKSMLLKESTSLSEATLKNITAAKDKEIGDLKDDLFKAKEKLLDKHSETSKTIQDLESKLAKSHMLLDEQAKELTEKTKVLNGLENKERELVATIRRLSAMAEEQRRQILNLEEQNEASLSFFQEKMTSLQERIRSLQAAESNIKTMSELLEKTKEELGHKQNVLSETTARLRDAMAEAAEKHLAYSREKGQLCERIEKLEFELKTVSERQENDSQAVRIKEKMLDDQNATIRNLKQNLDNKIREHNTLVEETSQIEDKFREEMKRISRLSAELRHELEEAESTIEGLQSDREELLSEKEKLVAELQEVSGKLKARNESIAHIEVEVEKVKLAFKRKEDKLLSENESLIRSHDSLQKEMEHLLDLNMTKIRGLEREKDALIDSIRKMEVELQSVDNLKERHREEMVVILGELEKQRSKFSKLKEAISES